MTTAADLTRDWQAHAAAMFSFTAFTARRLSVGLAEVAALERLQVSGPLSPGRLGRALSMPSASITALVDRLEYKRMVTRRPNPGDRRGCVIHLTQTAAERAALDMVPVAEALTRLAQATPACDRAVIAAYLEAVVGILDRQRVLAD